MLKNVNYITKNIDFYVTSTKASLVVSGQLVKVL